MPKLFYNILNPEQKKILPKLAVFKEDFYLAGGTALAFWLGHRRSIDFDFFSDKSFSTEKLFEKVEIIFKGNKIEKIQDEKDTLMINSKFKNNFKILSFEFI